MASWVRVRLQDDQAIGRPIDRQFRHGMRAEGEEWCDVQINIRQTNT